MIPVYSHSLIFPLMLTVFFLISNGSFLFHGDEFGFGMWLCTIEGGRNKAIKGIYLGHEQWSWKNVWPQFA